MLESIFKLCLCAAVFCQIVQAHTCVHTYIRLCMCSCAIIAVVTSQLMGLCLSGNANESACMANGNGEATDREAQLQIENKV